MQRPQPSLIQSWFEEKQSAWLYRVIAEQEGNRPKRRLFLKLAQLADSQALIWEHKIRSQGKAPKPFRPGWRARWVACMVRRAGPAAMRPVLATLKVRGLSVYAGRDVGTGHPMPTSLAEVGRRHRSIAGGNLRAAVFGINDGLVSNTSLIMGMAGANDHVSLVLLSGIAGLLAGALSMAAGEYISMRSQRELYEYQIDLERTELAMYPEEEAEELALIYAARGMNLHEARRFTRTITQNPESALDLLAREELGLNPDDLGSPWNAALLSFLSFTTGAAIPLVPFLIHLEMQTALQFSALLAGVGLFIVGAALSLFTGRSAFYGGIRMLLLGGSAGLATYTIGSLLGVSLS